MLNVEDDYSNPSSDKLNSKKYVCCFQCYAVLDKYLNVSLISNIMVNGIAPQIPPELNTPSCHFVVAAWCGGVEVEH